MYGLLMLIKSLPSLFPELFVSFNNEQVFRECKILQSPRHYVYK